MFGPDILVSVIWEQGKTSKRLYLPGGETWIDAWQKDKEYTGEDYVEVKTPIYKIPVFIRKGASVNLPDLNELYSESLELAQQKKDISILEAKEEWR